MKKMSENVFCYALYNFGPSGKKYEPNEKYKVDLLKKSFINAIADIKETSVENIEKRIWRPTGFLSKDPTPIEISEDEREILYDKVLDYATEEFEKISQDPRNEIRSDLSKILDNRMLNLRPVTPGENVYNKKTTNKRYFFMMELVIYFQIFLQLCF
jgi:hypothetical protein